MSWKAFLAGLLVVNFLLFCVQTGYVESINVEEYFPTVAESGLWYKYDTSRNVTGSFHILTKSEYVEVKSASVLNDVFSVSIVVRTEEYHNGTLIHNGSATFNINVPLSEVPSKQTFLWFFFNAKQVYRAVELYTAGLSGLLQNVTASGTYYDNYTYNNTVRTVVVSYLNGTDLGGTEFVHAKYIVDNETGLLLEKTYFRYRYMSVKVSLVEAERTVLRETNFFKVPEEVEETGETPMLTWRYWVIVTVSVVMIAVVVWLKWRQQSILQMIL